MLSTKGKGSLTNEEKGKETKRQRDLETMTETQKQREKQKDTHIYRGREQKDRSGTLGAPEFLRDLTLAGAEMQKVDVRTGLVASEIALLPS